MSSAAVDADVEKATEWYLKIGSLAVKANSLFQHALALTAEDGASAEEATSVYSCPFYDEKEEEKQLEAAVEVTVHRTELVRAILMNYERKVTKERVAALHWVISTFHEEPKLLDADDNGLRGAFGRYAYLAVAVLRFLRELATEAAPPNLDKMQAMLTALIERRQRLLHRLLEMTRSGHELLVLAGIKKSYETAVEAEIECALHWTWHWLAQNPSATPADVGEQLAPYAPIAAVFANAPL
jgi:hypothetical protein